MNILRLRIKSADEWRELAPSETVTEPIFVPTTDELNAGESVIVEVSSAVTATELPEMPCPPALRMSAVTSLSIVFEATLAASEMLPAMPPIAAAKAAAPACAVMVE